VETPGGVGYIRGGADLGAKPWVSERTGRQHDWGWVTAGGPVRLLDVEGETW
jgi:hypothetical protein